MSVRSSDFFDAADAFAIYSKGATLLRAVASQNRYLEIDKVPCETLAEFVLLVDKVSVFTRSDGIDDKAAIKDVAERASVEVARVVSATHRAAER